MQTVIVQSFGIVSLLCLYACRGKECDEGVYVTDAVVVVVIVVVVVVV